MDQEELSRETMCVTGNKAERVGLPSLVGVQMMLP